MSPNLPDTTRAKSMAKTINRETSIGHGRALDLVARLHGAADWNALSAAIESHASEPTQPNPETLDEASLHAELERRGWILSIAPRAEFIQIRHPHLDWATIMDRLDRFERALGASTVPETIAEIEDQIYSDLDPDSDA